MIYDIKPTPPIIFGYGASEQTLVKVKEFVCKKLLVVHGKVIKRTGIADKIIGSLEKKAWK